MGRKAERSEQPTPSERAKKEPDYRALRDHRRAEFGAAVRRLRIEEGLDQADLAAKTGFHRAYIGQVERGEVNVTMDNMWGLADGLDASLSELVEEL